MTKLERNQPHSAFISAGRKAFLIGTDFADNPYQGKYRTLWEKGYLQTGAKYPPRDRLPYGT
jgi:hypothetical protein